MSNYYNRFKLMTKVFPWRTSIRFFYGLCIQDLEKHKKIDFLKEDFTALLCGVSGEVTADEFIKFVLSKNPHSHIQIIDYGEPQVDAVKKLLQQKYKTLPIEVKQANALNLQHIKNNSIDWIETDGFLEYFDKKDLQQLFTEWKRILKKDGFITLREFSSNSWLGTIIDKLRVIVFKSYLGGTIYIHTKTELEDIFNKNGFQYVSGYTPYATYRRYSLFRN